MTNNRIRIVPFEMKYLNDYYNGFDDEITKYQWPDPFNSIDDARELLQRFLDEMKKDETLLFAIINEDDRFVGSVEMHGLSEDSPELGVWIIEPQQRKGYAYEALTYILNLAQDEYGKNSFFYEADIRNVGSTKLLNKFSDCYEIDNFDVEEFVTDSGKELQLQSSILKVKK